MSAKKKKTPTRKPTRRTNALNAVAVAARMPAIAAAAGPQASPRNPPRAEIAYVVIALLAAKAGVPPAQVGEGQNLGTPPPLGLDKTAFLTLLKPLNNLLDNYEGSGRFEKAELEKLYDDRKKVRHLIDATHAKAQVQS